METPDSHFMTMNEAAAYLKVSRTSLIRLMRIGDAPPSFKLGKVFRFDINRIDAWCLAKEKAHGARRRGVVDYGRRGRPSRGSGNDAADGILPQPDSK